MLVGQSPPKGQARPGWRILVRTVMCAVPHGGWGVNCPQAGLRTGLAFVWSLSFLLLTSALGMQPDLMSVTHREERLRRGPGVEDECPLSSSGFLGVCLGFPFCSGTCSNSRGRRPRQGRAGAGSCWRGVKVAGPSEVEGTCVIRKQSWRVLGSVGHSCPHTPVTRCSLLCPYSREMHTGLHHEAWARVSQQRC